MLLDQLDKIDDEIQKLMEDKLAILKALQVLVESWEEAITI